MLLDFYSYQISLQTPLLSVATAIAISIAMSFSSNAGDEEGSSPLLSSAESVNKLTENCGKSLIVFIGQTQQLGGKFNKMNNVYREVTQVAEAMNSTNG